MFWITWGRYSKRRKIRGPWSPFFILVNTLILTINFLCFYKTPSGAKKI